jgi:hypothetical protein
VFIDLGDVADALILADGSFETTSHMLARRGSTDKFLTQDSTFLSTRKSIRSLSVSSEGGTMGGDTNHGSTSSSKKGGGGGGSSSSASRFASVKMPRSMKAMGTANELAESATASSAPTDKKGVSFFPASKELMTEEREGKKEEKERKSVGFSSSVLPSSSKCTNNGVSSSGGGVGEKKKKKSVLIKTPMEENNTIYQL